MTDRIAKAVSVMSSVYEVKSSIRKIFYSKKHFPKILGASMLCAFVGSYSMMESIHQGRLKVRSSQEFGWKLLIISALLLIFEY